MTVSEMLDAVGRIMDDPGKDRWDATTKLQALNAAQMKVIKSLPSDLLPELQASKASLTVPAAGYALSGLDSDPGPFLPGRYVNANVTSLSLWAGFVTVEDLEFRTQNEYLRGTDEAPVAYVFGEKLFVEADEAESTVTLYYIRRPKEMVATGMAGYQVETCELEESRHDLVVEAACAQLHRWEGDLQEAKIHEQHVGQELLAEVQTFQAEQQKPNRR